jgi:adenylate cyclase
MGFDSNLSSMKFTSYEHWLGNQNTQMIEDITRCMVSGAACSSVSYKFAPKGLKSPCYIDYHILPAGFDYEMASLLENIGTKNMNSKSLYEGLSDIKETVIIIQKSNPVKTMLQNLSIQIPSNLSQSLAANPALLEGVNMDVTIVAINLRGFAAIASQLSPKTVLEYLNYFHEYVSHVVAENGGIITQSQGENIVCTFGAPFRLASNEIQAVSTAFALQKNISDENLRIKSKLLPQMKIGIGISKGNAFCGPVGSKNIIQYQVIGECINDAVLLQRLGGNYGCPIIIGSEMKDACSNFFHLRLIDSLKAGQFEKPLHIFEVYGSAELELKHDTMTVT